MKRILNQIRYVVSVIKIIIIGVCMLATRFVARMQQHDTEHCFAFAAFIKENTACKQVNWENEQRIPNTYLTLFTLIINEFV